MGKIILNSLYQNENIELDIKEILNETFGDNGDGKDVIIDVEIPEGITFFYVSVYSGSLSYFANDKGYIKSDDCTEQFLQYWNLGGTYKPGVYSKFYTKPKNQIGHIKMNAPQSWSNGRLYKIFKIY